MYCARCFGGPLIQISSLTKTQDSCIFPAVERRQKKLYTQIKVNYYLIWSVVSHIHARKNTLENERELKVKISLLKKGGQAVQNAKLKKKKRKKKYIRLRDELSASSWATDVFERFAAVHAWQQIELHLKKLESRKMKNLQQHRIAHTNGSRGAFAKESQSRTTTTTQVREQRVSFFSPRRVVWPECSAFGALRKLGEQEPTTAIAAA
uniref:Uncharacterized protein n=1 Tax=Trichogramma kaykai TaxID=54128 RepID=A0ABD2WHK8_9HYME